MGSYEIDFQRLNFDAILIRKSLSGYNLLDIRDFLDMPVDRRIELIMERRIRFASGEDEVSPYAALKSLEQARKPAA